MLPPLTSRPPESPWIADQLGDPPHRLRLDFGGRRRQRPRADVGIDGGGEQVARIPIGAGGAVMYPKNRGCPLKSE